METRTRTRKRKRSRATVPTPREAVAIQRELAARVVMRWEGGGIETVAGVDIAVKGGRARAAVCVLEYPGMELVEQRTAVRPLEFPYVPGLLGFREVPAIAEAFEKVASPVDVVLVDGHGYAHPRRFGVACHVGVELGVPSIGVGKSRLVGEHREPGRRRGCRTLVKDRGEVIGVCLRTRDGVKPVYVSVGHRVDLEMAVKVVLRCGRGVRLPEPVRCADRLAGEG